MNQDNPLISIIVPVYNIEDYLERCVNSIIEQTYSNLEILLINDGSTDGSGEICQKLQKKDDRIKVFHKSNGGSSSARNFGILEARGEYFGFVDSDDYIEPDMYENLVRAMVKSPVKITQISRDEIAEDGSSLKLVCQPPEIETTYDSKEFLRQLLLHKGDCSFCTKLVSRDLFANRKFPQGMLNEDFYLLIQLLEDGEAITSLPPVGYHVFYKQNSNTRKKDPENFSRVFEDIIENAERVDIIVKRTFPELGKVSLRFGLFQRLDYMLHIPISKMVATNVFYKNQVSYLRKHWKDTLFNPFLTSKNKCYLVLFTIMPKSTRKIHRIFMELRNFGKLKGRK